MLLAIKAGGNHANKTAAELAQQFDVRANQITRWKTQLLDRAGVVFAGGGHPEGPPIDVKALHAKIGELTLENDFFRRSALQAGLGERKTMIDRTHPLPITRQAETLGMARSTVYALPRPVSGHDLDLTRPEHQSAESGVCHGHAFLP